MTAIKPPVVLPADAAGIAAAARAIMADGIVAVPTETVYGLAARADREAAVAEIYRAKGRPDFNPLIVHVADVAAAEQLAVFDDRALRLAKALWPGALTLVLPRRVGAALAAAVSAGLPTIALRCPAHPVMHDLLLACGLPLAAPSANRSGGVSPTSAGHVVASLGARVPLILDGGSSADGIESTIVALRPGGAWAILRPGPIGKADLAKLLDCDPEEAAPQGAHIEAPGQMMSHYAPGKPLRLNALFAEPDEFMIGFAGVGGQLSLSLVGDLGEAAARLYACLHVAASAVQPRIAVAPVPEEGIGAAINDRLRRAAA